MHIDTLPIELLAAIFKAGSSGSAGARFPFLVSSVNRHWRNVAINSPAVWSQIYVSDSSSLANVTLWIERSQSHLIDITIQYFDILMSNNRISIRNLLRLHVDRWRRLDMSSVDIKSLQHLMEPFRHVSFSHLEYIRISLLYAEHWLTHDNHYALLTPGSSLHSLDLDGVCLRCSPPLTGLTILNLDRFKLDYTELAHLFTMCPGIAELVIQGLEVDETEEVSVPAVESLSLRTVAFGLETQGPQSMPFFRFSLPNLEYLELQYYGQEDLNWDTDNFSKRQYPKLHTLRLHAFRLSHIPSAFFSLFPSITSLEFIETQDSPPFSRTDNPMWPNLRCIIFKSPTEVIDWVQDMVDRRGAIGFRQPKILLPESSKDSEFAAQLTKLLVVDFFNASDYSGLVQEKGDRNNSDYDYDVEDTDFDLDTFDAYDQYAEYGEFDEFEDSFDDSGESLDGVESYF